MAQASVLTDHEIRKVFRIIETTRQAERNRIAFMLSIYAGLRVGQIAALTIGDVVAHVAAQLSLCLRPQSAASSLAGIGATAATVTPPYERIGRGGVSD